MGTCCIKEACWWKSMTLSDLAVFVHIVGWLKLRPSKNLPNLNLPDFLRF